MMPEPQPSGSRAEWDFPTGGGEMGALIRACDWSSTPLGPVGSWPAALRTVVGLLRDSRYPMFVFWGPERVKLYNDAYAPILGAKHPWALGRPGPEVWPEIWDTIGPMVRQVFETGRPTWSDDLMLFMRRRGFTEECYFSFSYSPVRGEAGSVAGMFCLCSETTGKVLGERRLRTLRRIAASTAEAKSAAEACRLAAEALEGNDRDVPFALIYLVGPDGREARLAAAAGVAAGHAVAPQAVGLDDAGAAWPLGKVAAGGAAEIVEDLARRFPAVPDRPWAEPPRQAVVLPLADRGRDRPTGFLVAGVSPRLRLDEQYRSFLSLTADHIAAAVANAAAYEAEKRRAEALAELDRAKTAFFSNVSHEFRTPLTLMLGPLEDILAEADGALPAAHRSRLEIARRNGLRLLKLVNTLLDFSRIEAGRAEAAYRPTDLAAFTAQPASVFRAAFEAAGLSLTIDCPPLPEPAWVDRDMWEKIVLNLLSNAFKHTFEGGAAVSLRRADDRIELVVADSGIGIPEEELPRIFERFHRVKGAGSRTHEGAGIGLSLVQELVRLHGGTITAARRVGGGTSFTVSVPAGAGHLLAERLADTGGPSANAGAIPFVEEALRWLPEPAEDPPAAIERRGGSEAARVLLADDNADMRAYVRRLLEAAGFSVEAVGDGDAAAARTPDLVLADDLQADLDLAARLSAGEIPTYFLEKRYLRPDGTPVWVGLTASAVRRADGRPECFIAVVQDITDRKRAGEELRAAKEAAEAASRSKDEFLSVLSHELRTPLTAMVGWIRLLRNGSLEPAEAAIALETVERNRPEMSRRRRSSGSSQSRAVACAVGRHVDRSPRQ
jgi:PAS domain S-box-containing protein